MKTGLPISSVGNPHPVNIDGSDPGGEEDNNWRDLKDIIRRLQDIEDNRREDKVTENNKDVAETTEDIGEIEIDDTYSTEEENQKEVSKIANDLRTK